MEDNGMKPTGLLAALRRLLPSGKRPFPAQERRRLHFSDGHVVEFEVRVVPGAPPLRREDPSEALDRRARVAAPAPGAHTTGSMPPIGSSGKRSPPVPGHRAGCPLLNEFLDRRAGR